MIALHHTGLTVSDLDRALQFWCDALGGRLIFRQEREGGYFAAIVREPEAKVRMAQVELVGGGHRVELFQFDRPAAGSHRSRPADVGFAHICVVICELDLLLARLGPSGGTKVSDPVAIDAGVNAGGRVVYVRDPDGHALEVLQPEQTYGMGLAGKQCVVTGAAAGIGAAIAGRLGLGGATVAVWDVDYEHAQTVARAVGGSAHRCDVAEREQVEAAFAETLDLHTRIDVLVNNAGISLMGPSETFSSRDWERSIGVMQTGVFHCSQVMGRHMLEQGAGAIVNVSSINAREAFPMRLAYCAAKAAVIAMTEVLAVEWADPGIRVNAVAPGVTRTALVQKAIEEGGVDVERYQARTPLQRFGEPDEIARAVVFLADEEQSSFVTGTTLTVDGGWSAQGWIS